MVEILPHSQTAHFLPEYSFFLFPDIGIYPHPGHCRQHKIHHRNTSENLRYGMLTNAVPYWNVSVQPILFLPAHQTGHQLLQNGIPDIQKHPVPIGQLLHLLIFPPFPQEFPVFLTVPLYRFFLKFLTVQSHQFFLPFRLKPIPLFPLHPACLQHPVPYRLSYPDNQTWTSDDRLTLWSAVPVPWLEI